MSHVSLINTSSTPIRFASRSYTRILSHNQAFLSTNLTFHAFMITQLTDIPNNVAYLHVEIMIVYNFVDPISSISLTPMTPKLVVEYYSNFLLIYTYIACVKYVCAPVFCLRGIHRILFYNNVFTCITILSSTRLI